ncbi:MAG: hypothetical protein Q8P48_05805 [Deltaproteobacteria bacterium]|nr:hypothetical protein [Deltaproteobacteria bacterium]
METIGIVIALHAEARALFGAGLWRRAAGLRLRRVEFSGAELLCACAGPGGHRGEQAALWLAGQGAAALASIGVAGGLDPALDAGDIVVAKTVSGEGKRAFSPEPYCVGFAIRALRASGIKATEGEVVTVDEPALTARKKKSVFRQSRGSAVDMESASVARVAEEAGLPFFALRAVSDPCGSSISEELIECVADDGSLRAAILAGKLVRKPSLLRDLLRARREFSSALSSLKDAWGVLLQSGLPALLASARGRGQEARGEAASCKAPTG